MIRRFTLATLAGLFCAAAVVDTASALTRAQAICVRGARQDAREKLTAARDQIRNGLNTQYGICLNDKSGCVTACVNAQTACLVSPKAAVKLCGVTCTGVQQDDINDCRAVAPAAAVACVEAAQLKLFNCNQDCVAQHQGEVIVCSGLFNDCLETCSQ